MQVNLAFVSFLERDKYDSGRSIDRLARLRGYIPRLLPTGINKVIKAALPHITISCFDVGRPRWHVVMGVVYLFSTDVTLAQSLAELSFGPAIRKMQTSPGIIADFARLPNKPGNVVAQQLSVSWKIPDQANGKTIAQWLVRACPKDDSNPNAPCQQTAILNGPNGLLNGTSLQAEIPSHVLYLGAERQVMSAEICAKNSAGVSCADRVILNTAGIKPLSLFGSALHPNSSVPDGSSAATTSSPGISGRTSPVNAATPTPSTAGLAKSGAEQGGGSPLGVQAAPVIHALQKMPQPLVVAASMLSLRVSAPPPLQSIAVSVVPLKFEASAISAPSMITVSASPLRLSASSKTGSGRVALSPIKIASASNGIVVNAEPLKIKVLDAGSIEPIVVETLPLTIKASAASSLAPILISVVPLKLSVGSHP